MNPSGNDSLSRLTYVFTSAARALLLSDQDEDWLTRTTRHMGERGALRDLVRLPPCRATFQIVSRIWTVSEHGEQLLVVLDLAPGEPILSLV